jgi:hypothetical protein
MNRPADSASQLRSRVWEACALECYQPQPGIVPVSTPPRQPAAYYHESEQEYEQPSSSDDGVQVEAEESELEELGHEDLEDEYGNGGVEGETPVVLPPPPPPRSTRPPVPNTRPPVPSSLLPGRSGSSITITPVPRPPVRQSASDFVMVEPEEAPLPSPSRVHSRVPSHQWSVHPPQESSDLAGSSQWELPSIPSGSLDLGTGELSGSMWSEDSTAYPPAVPSRSSISTPRPHLGRRTAAASYTCGCSVSDDV